MKKQVEVQKSVMVDIESLQAHPRNYRSHPEDQINHLMESIRQSGVYRNIVATRDGTILAGHGVVEASQRLGLGKIPVSYLDVEPDDPLAIKVMTADNLISHLSDDDDRALSELLKELADIDELLGTGFDEKMLAGLAMVTRPKSEVKDFSAAAEWVGMPEFDAGTEEIKLIVRFRSEEDRTNLLKKLGMEEDVQLVGKSTATVWYPPKERQDLSSILFEEEDGK